MSSIVKQIFLLAVFVMLQSGTTAQVIVTGAPLPSDGSVPARESIHDVDADPIKRNCFLLGLECMQNMSPDDPNSYRLVAAIHGTNRVWNNDRNGMRTVGGYCPHGNITFPTWHRAYLALFEQVFCSCMISTIQQFSDATVRDEHMRVAEKMRLPYFDWAENRPPPSILGTNAANLTVTVRRMEGGSLSYVTIPNPCSAYTLQPAGDSMASIGSQTRTTVRYGTRQGGVYVSRPDAFRTNIDNGDGGWRSSVENTFEGATTFAQFAVSGGRNFNPIETPHNTFHTASGGSPGHMASVTTAAFDPLFWLHHCNVDRLTALYQACYPDRLFTGTVSGVNVNSPLYPFRAPSGGYWTSQTVWNTGNLRYRYAEADTQATAIAAVKRLYNADVTGRRKRNLDTINRVNTEEVSDNLARVARARRGKDDTADNCESYDKYHARITISNGAADGSSTVYLFLCEPYANEDYYVTDRCYVGRMGVFSSPGLPKSQRRLYTGTVSLTDALEDRYVAGELKDMKTKTVTDYLQNRLIWKIVGKQTPDCDLNGFDIHVVKIKVNAPNNRYTLPYWKETTELCKVA